MFCFTALSLKPHKIFKPMRKFFSLTAALIVAFLNVTAQSNGIVSGPMLGPVELRDAKVWLEVAPRSKKRIIGNSKKRRSQNN